MITKCKDISYLSRCGLKEIKISNTPLLTKAIKYSSIMEKLFLEYHDIFGKSSDIWYLDNNCIDLQLSTAFSTMDIDSLGNKENCETNPFNDESMSEQSIESIGGELESIIKDDVTPELLNKDISTVNEHKQVEFEKLQNKVNSLTVFSNKIFLE